MVINNAVVPKVRPCRPFLVCETFQFGLQDKKKLTKNSPFQASFFIFVKIVNYTTTDFYIMVRRVGL